MWPKYKAAFMVALTLAGLLLLSFLLNFEREVTEYGALRSGQAIGRFIGQYVLIPLIAAGITAAFIKWRRPKTDTIPVITPPGRIE